jgi:hypothetical protein
MSLIGTMYFHNQIKAAMAREGNLLHADKLLLHIRLFWSQFECMEHLYVMIPQMFTRARDPTSATAHEAKRNPN